MAQQSWTSTALVVGEISGDTAVLTDASELLVCRMPLAWLPQGLAVGVLCAFPDYNSPWLAKNTAHNVQNVPSPTFTGHVVDLHAARSQPAEESREREILDLQAQLMSRFGPSNIGTGSGQDKHASTAVNT